MNIEQKYFKQVLIYVIMCTNLARMVGNMITHKQINLVPKSEEYINIGCENHSVKL